MKRRIGQLLNGIFEYEMPQMVLSESEISAVVRKGEIFRGHFTLENAAQRKINGFIYSSNARMGYEPSDFAAISEKIVYEFDTTGMTEGDILYGAFTICSDIGEYQVPYRIEIERSVVKTSTAVIADMAAFVELARNDFQKAYLIFISAGFRKMLYETMPEWISLYEGIFSKSVSYSSLEEFLIAIKKKESIRLQLDKKEMYFDSLMQSMKESVVLTKNTWGFLKMNISSDAPFLSPLRPEITTDEFIGSTYTLEYLINPEKLHKGKNSGRITVNAGPCQLLTVEVTVAKAGDHQTTLRLLKQQEQVAKLFSKYLDFRLKRIPVDAWIRDSQEALAVYHQAGGVHVMLNLYQAHLFFAAGKTDQGCLVLEKVDESERKMVTPEIMGYYLYLTTFYNKAPEYIDYVEESITHLFLQNQENWKLQWILLYLKESLMQHPTEKLAAIRQQFVCGCRSRMMYLEAYFIIMKAPMLLKRMGEFELQLLKFMCREKLLTEDVILQVTELSGRGKEYSKDLYYILTCCYQKQPSNKLLTVICSLLIKGQKSAEVYFGWYEKGVKADLRMAGLYEYYVESMGTQEPGPLPQMIRMYFSYHNTLSYYQKARVYANVIRNREKDPQTYHSYRPIIEKFMVDQLYAARINRDLALIYKTFLTRSILNKQMAEYLSKALFTYEIQCKSPAAVYAVVVHKQLKWEQKVLLLNQSAQLQLYTRDCRIFIEDREGNRYAASIPYTISRLMDVPAFMDDCRKLAPNSPGLTLYSCGRADRKPPVHPGNVAAFCHLLDIDEVKDSYKKQVRREILDFYYENQTEESLFEYLHRIDCNAFVLIDKRKLVELLTVVGMYEKAFELVSKYGVETIDLLPLVRMCSRSILNLEYAADEMLIAICVYCFEHQKYDETMLTYLVNYYDGPIEAMKALWRAGKQFELDMFYLEEKILMVLLFTRTGGADTEEIFDAYRRKSGQKKLIQAYTIYCAYNYFVKEVPVQDVVFEYLQREYAKGNDLDEVCLLALLRWLSMRPELEKNQEEYVQRIMEEFVYREMRFAFYEKFDDSLIRAFLLQDKRFIEYRTSPKAEVTIHYYMEQQNGEKTEVMVEPMANVYEGIFEKEITLFYGEKLKYHIVEERNGVVSETAEKVCEWRRRNRKNSNSRYDLLNDMLEKLEKKEQAAATKTMQVYLEQERLIDQLFTLTQTPER